MRWSAIVGYTQQGIMLREDDTGETSQQYATGMDDDMSVRLQTETIISMAGFAVTTGISGIPDRRAPHRRRRAVGTGACGDHPPYRPGDGLHRRDHGLIVGQARLAAGNNRPLIRAVADRLDRYGFYTGEEIQRILDESVKELDQ